MKRFLVGLMLAALLAPSAYAQQRETTPAPAPAEPGEFLIWFDTNQSTLTPEGLRVVAQAAQAYQERGAARDHRHRPYRYRGLGGL